jgi:hypothetical protein
VGNIKGLLVLGGAILAGKWVAERFILKNPNTGSGFVEVGEGFGMDDVAVVGVQVALVLVGRKFIGG